MARELRPFPALPLPCALTASFALLIAMSPFATAQGALIPKPISDAGTEHARPELPDSLDALVGSSSSSTNVPDSGTDPDGAAAASANSASIHWAHLQIIVKPGDIAEPMTVRKKIVIGLKSSVTLFSVTGWFSYAGLEQLRNSSPNYGTDAGAFGQRLGAATIRGTSDGVFSKSLFAPLFHEDPRYYIMGPGHQGFKRLGYAITRVFITRTDSGHMTPNFSLFAGNAAGSALTIAYYPGINTTATQVASTFGSSLGGSAFGFVVNEFLVDALIDLHLEKKKQP